MNRPVLLVFACLVFPLAACALLNSAETDTAPLFPGFENPELHGTTPRADPELTVSLEQLVAEFREQEFALRVRVVSYELAMAIIEGRALRTPLNADKLNEVFAAMFERSLDSASPPKASWFKEFGGLVTYLSNGEVTLHQTTAEDKVFAKHPSAKKAWRSAHVFIRVERVMKDGKKRSSGIILSAPEPEEKRTSFPVDDEEDVLPSAPTMSPLGQ